jgi:hypothetical protein
VGDVAEAPRASLLAGGATLVLGIALTVKLVVLRGRWTSDALGSQGDVTLASASCQSYTAAIHWTYLLLGLGAVLFVAAALSGTNVVQKGPDGD